MNNESEEYIDTEEIISIENNKQEVIEYLSERNIVKISNNLCSAQYKISAVSLNIFLMLLTEISIEDDELKTYDISLLQIEKKLNKKLNRSPKNREKICSDLTGNNLCLVDSNDFMPLCSQCELIKEEGIWFIQIQINPELKEELLNLTREFTKINLTQFLQLSGLKVKRMYMIMCQVSGLPDWKVYLKKLHTILSLTDSYTNTFDNFKTKILTPLLTQINALNNKEIEVSYTVDKKSTRSVKLLNFKVKKVANNKIKSANKKLTAKEQKAAHNKEQWDRACNGEIFNDEDDKDSDV